MVGAGTRKGRRVLRDLAEAGFDTQGVAPGEHAQGVDIFIGCLKGTLQEEVNAARTALEQSAPYFSGNEDPESVESLLDLDDEARSLGSTVIAGCSWSPALSGVLARLAAEELGSVGGVQVSWVVSEGGPLATNLGAEGEEVYFPEPLGWRRVSSVNGSETLTIPRSLPMVEKVVVKGGTTEKRGDRFLQRLGGNRGRYPDSWSALRVDAFGLEQDRTSTVSLAVMDKLANLESATLLVAALLYSRGELLVQGASTLDAEVSPTTVIQLLSERGSPVARLHRHHP